MIERTRRVLLLGAGFMARALAARLAPLGYEIHVIIRGATHDLPPYINVHGGGMENIRAIKHLLPEFGAIVHMASGTTPSLSNKTPTLEATNNLGPTLEVLENLLHVSRTRLVYISSGGTVYGNPHTPLVSETAPLEPLSFYGCGKVATEEFVRCFERATGNPLTILRPSNLYGPGQPRYQGFGVVRTLLQHALDGTTMNIWGDGSVVRDFVYIDDMVAALELVLGEEDARGTFNVGSGVGYSLNELVTLVERVCGQRLRIEYGQPRGIDVKHIVLDIASMKRRFGWTPRTNLQSGIAKTWEWLQTQPNSL